MCGSVDKRVAQVGLHAISAEDWAEVCGWRAPSRTSPAAKWLHRQGMQTSALTLGRSMLKLCDASSRAASKGRSCGSAPFQPRLVLHPALPAPADGMAHASSCMTPSGQISGAGLEQCRQHHMKLGLQSMQLAPDAQQGHASCAQSAHRLTWSWSLFPPLRAANACRQACLPAGHAHVSGP